MAASRSRLVRWAHRLRDDRRGAIAAVAAVAAVPLIGLTGIGIDAARGYMLKQRMSQALDAAGLAGGRAVFSASFSADVSKYYFANIPQGYLDATLQAPVVSTTANKDTVTLTASAELPTTFTRILGVEDMTVNARSVIKRANRGLELVLSLDSTGSMDDNNKIGKLKTAANQLLDIIYGETIDTVDNLYVGVVPYTTTVNIGNNRSGWLTGPTAGLYGAGTWRGCVEARAYPYEEGQADVPPATQKFKPYLYATTYNQSWYYNGNKVTNSYTSDNNWQPSNATNSHTSAGPNKYCQVASKAEILPLQPSKAKAKQAIAAMDADSIGTLTNVGLSWGWRMLAPEWRGLWGTSQQWGSTTPASLPLDYDTPAMDKTLILLTDGLTNMPAGNGQTGCSSGSTPCSFPYGSYTAFGRLSEARLGTVKKSTADATLNNRIIETCTAMKAKGITIYTIVLQESSQTVQNVFSACASSPAHFYNSPTADQLSSVFQQIAIQLSNLRLAE